MKLVRCFWRTDRLCPHPALCRYGYDCVARPKGRTMTTTLRPPCLMDLDELTAARARYAPMIALELHARISVLTDEERGHAYEVEGAYRAWKEAIRWSYARR